MEKKRKFAFRDHKGSLCFLIENLGNIRLSCEQGACLTVANYNNSFKFKSVASQNSGLGLSVVIRIVL